MSNNNNAVSSASKKTKYQTLLIRNTSTPSEKRLGDASYTAVFNARELLKMGTKKNLRSFIGEHNPRMRNHTHKAIEDTIKNKPDYFPKFNGGCVVIASEIKINNESGEITLTDESLINGAQTQGEIARYYAELALAAQEAEEEFPTFPDFDVKAEIIIEQDEDMVAEIAIARNDSTPVKKISMAGARGQLDGLYNRMNSFNSNYRIEKSETDKSDADVNSNITTAFLLQIIRLFTPATIIMGKGKEKNASEMLKPYKNSAQCLADFCEWERTKDTNPKSNAMYEFTIQMAPYAWEEYLLWNSHRQWTGTGLQTYYKGSQKKIGTKKGNRWIDICNGLLFPVLQCLSNFVAQDASGDWKIDKPEIFDEARVLKKAVEILTGNDYYYDPMQMGRGIGAYSTLDEYPRTLAEVIKYTS